MNKEEFLTCLQKASISNLTWRWIGVMINDDVYLNEQRTLAALGALAALDNKEHCQLGEFLLSLMTVATFINSCR